MKPERLYARSWDAQALVVAHPPVLRHTQKQAVAGMVEAHAVPVGGTVTVSRWRAQPLPPLLNLVPTEPLLVPGTYDYAVDPGQIWHVNFADPDLFAAYGSALLAQDELQVLEHPTLGSVREALLAEGLSTRTVERDDPTPILVTGVQRRCVLDTEPSAARPFGLYGNRFARASSAALSGALRYPDPPVLTQLICIAAPVGAAEPYQRSEIERILITAYAGFAAAAAHSDDEDVEIRTGFWGCGAFGGDRVMMVALQALAACMAGVDRLVFYAFDDAGERDVAEGLQALDRVQVRIGEPTGAVLDRIVGLGRRWGTPDGN